MTTGDGVYSLRFSLVKILPELRFDLGSTAGESGVLTAHAIYCMPVDDNYHNTTNSNNIKQSCVVSITPLSTINCTTGT